MTKKSITEQNDELTRELIEYIRDYETTYNTNVDVNVSYGHFSNKLTFTYNNTVKTVDIERNENTQYTVDYIDYQCTIMKILLDMTWCIINTK